MHSYRVWRCMCAQLWVCTGGVEADVCIAMVCAGGVEVCGCIAMGVRWGWGGVCVHSYGCVLGVLRGVCIAMGVRWGC